MHQPIMQPVASRLAKAEFGGDKAMDALTRRRRDEREREWLTTYRPLTLAVAGDPNPASMADQVLAAVWKAEAREGPPPSGVSLKGIRPTSGVMDIYEDTAENRRRARVGQPHWKEA